MTKSRAKRTGWRAGPSRSRSRPFSEGQGNRVKSYTNCKDFGFPDRYSCKLKYTSTDTLSGTGSTTQKVFRLNSLFDPDLSGTGAQPECFDQLTAVYNKYLVHACEYDCTFTNLNSTAVNVVAVPSDLALTGSTFDSITEQKRAKMASLSINSGGKSTVRLRGFVNMSDLHGQPNLDADPNQYAVVSANPTDVAFLTLEAADFTTATTISVGVRTKLTFYCTFKEFNIASDSLDANVVHETPPSSFIPQDVEANASALRILAELDTQVLEIKKLRAELHTLSNVNKKC